MHQASDSTLDLVAHESPANLSRVDLRPDAAANGQSGKRRAADNASDAKRASADDDHDELGAATSFVGFCSRPVRKFAARVSQTFKSKLGEARENSETNAELGAHFLRWLTGTLAWTACLALAVAFPVVLAVVGVLNLDSCPAKPSLPYLVFALGFVMTCSNGFNLALSLNLPVLSNQRVLTDDLKNIIASLANVLFNAFAAMLYMVTAAAVFSAPHSPESQSRPAPAPAPPARSANNSRPATEATTADTQPSACNHGFYNFTYYFTVLSLAAILAATLAWLAALAHSKYRAAIERGSTPKPGFEPHSPASVVTATPTTTKTGAK